MGASEPASLQALEAGRREGQQEETGEVNPAAKLIRNTTHYAGRRPWLNLKIPAIARDRLITQNRKSLHD
jgi:hypothetical protein